MSECVLIEEYGQCCCRCKHRLRLLGRFDRESGCFPQIGWVCIAFAFAEDTAYMGDFEHNGMCELFQRRQE